VPKVVEITIYLNTPKQTTMYAPTQLQGYAEVTSATPLLHLKITFW